MLIVSKFHDYYDTITAYGVDKTVVYQRSQQAHPLEEKYYIEPAATKRNRHNRYALPHGVVRCFGSFGSPRQAWGIVRVIGFCGKLYPVVEVKYRQTLDAVETSYTAYTAADAVCALAEVGIKLSKEPGWLGRPSIENLPGLREAFDPNFYKSFLPIFRDYRVPCFVAGEELCQKGEVSRPTRAQVILNPHLGQWKFQRMKDPATAFQDIYMYISGVLGVGAPDTVQIDDKHKAIAHGHDGKYSFRKPPGGGRWR